MAKKDTKPQTNVSHQLKQFNKNIGEEDEEIIYTPKEYFKKKVIESIDDVNITPIEIESNFIKISKEDLLQLVRYIPTIQIALRNDIIDMVVNNDNKLDICNKLDTIHTFDLVRINTIKQNL